MRASVFLIAAVLLAATSVWSVVPAPGLLTLLFAVVAPEWGLYAVLAGSVLAGCALRFAPGRLGLAAFGVSALAVAFALPSIVAYPGAVTAADGQLRRLTGDAGWSRSPYDFYSETGTIPVSIIDGVRVPLRDGTSSNLDLYEPQQTGAHPAVVIVYGGAWVFGDRRQCRPLAIDLAQAGYVAVMVDYRHAPKFRFPTQVDDVADALEAVARHARSWHIDPARIAVLGRSAGAEIALVLASTPQPVRVAAAIGIYAPLDLAGGYADPPRPDPANVRSILERYLGGPPDAQHLAAYRRASPQALTAGMRATTLLMIGTSDELVLPRFQRRYAATLEARRTPTVALELPLANHAFDSVPFGRGLAFERAVLLRFLHSALAPAPARSRSAG